MKPNNVYVLLWYKWFTDYRVSVAVVKTKKEMHQWCKNKGYKYNKEEDCFHNKEAMTGIIYEQVEFFKGDVS